MTEDELKQQLFNAYRYDEDTAIAKTWKEPKSETWKQAVQNDAEFKYKLDEFTQAYSKKLVNLDYYSHHLITTGSSVYDAIREIVERINKEYDVDLQQRTHSVTQAVDFWIDGMPESEYVTVTFECIEEVLTGPRDQLDNFFRNIGSGLKLKPLGAGYIYAPYIPLQYMKL